MKYASAAGNHVELLLTSGGITTTQMSDRLKAMSLISGSSSNVNVLRLADGWQPFNSRDPIGRAGRIEHFAESQAAKLWSKRYIQWSLGKRATVTTLAIGDVSYTEARSQLDNTDLLLVPGGNTYQTLRGISRHKDLIKEKVASGLPFVGESAGSIVAGKTIKPASIDPADICPDMGLLEASGLEFVGGDVLVHAIVNNNSFDINGPLARVTKIILASIASDVSTYKPVEDSNAIYILSESQALSVSNGVAQII